MDLNPEQTSDVDAARSLSSKTRRLMVAAIEAILHQPFPMFDHGFLRVVDRIGDDDAVV